MPLGPPRVIETTLPLAPPRLKPELLWPSHTGYGDQGRTDRSAFPSLAAIKARHAARPPQPLEAFLEAVWIARNRILVLDDYLFKPVGDQSQQERFDQILAWFDYSLVANDVRLLTNQNDDQSAIQAQFDSRAAEINFRAPRRDGKVKIEIRFSLGSSFPYVHDRYAIVDSELWHFGATVGGLHSQVNAASRGWDANTHEAVRFFDDAWAGDGDAVRRGGHG